MAMFLANDVASKNRPCANRNGPQAHPIDDAPISKTLYHLSGQPASRTLFCPAVIFIPSRRMILWLENTNNRKMAGTRQKCGTALTQKTT